uniref:NADH-ubiquinone oxidoreductase chain 3 n=1 Tax=Agasicles hygrophila TaxID=715812 RepID=A0A0U2MXB3_9CUCU|nr:NADH dehydrogenase subunit 3 [Agasicles hygrophila]ALJ78617.1 NADH dehydrogenase subunit 3 [Agasicles hygrophila]ASO76773.1 NADH dehydrogenase subunit 3 [Agasicles hygrophila]
MYILFNLNLLILIILTILIIVINLLSKKSFYDREKTSPFECGFDPMSSSRLPFSLHFFLIAIIFLIFDVEITLLLPFIVSLKLTNIMNFTYLLFFFILILLVGLYHEWNQGALNWTI